MSFVSDTGSVVVGAALSADTGAVQAQRKPEVAPRDLKRVRFALGLIVALAGLDALFYLSRLI